ncbi:MAG: cytochrome P450 [Cyanobacteriota bacterium]
MSNHELLSWSGSLLGVGLLSSWGLLRLWYFSRIRRLQNQVQHSNGQPLPGRDPRFLVGNLTEVYGSANRLSGYLSFHENFGKIVQIFWLWKQQISVASYAMAHHILQARASHYQKYPPNALLRRLFGSSVLTSHGEIWRRYRVLTQAALSPQRIPVFFEAMIAPVDTLMQTWETELARESSVAVVERDVYPDLITLCLEMISTVAVGPGLGRLGGKTQAFLDNIRLVIRCSTQPQYQFAPWWQHLPLAANRELAQAFAGIDEFLYGLIQAHRSQPTAQTAPESPTPLLDLLLQATESVDEALPPLSDPEIRDNLLAIILNGHESAATCLALTLALLAQHPEVMARAQAEVDRCLGSAPLSAERLQELPYLESVLQESLRLYPPMTGIQRVSVSSDQLEGWGIPEQQVIGIALMPLHRDPEFFGADPQSFRPERYAGNSTHSTDSTAKEPVRSSSGSRCPFSRLIHSGKTPTGIHWPLAFGDGPRRCLGEALAMTQMISVLALLLHRFEFRLAPGFAPEVELGKFGLFISMVPKDGVHLQIRLRDPHSL